MTSTLTPEQAAAMQRRPEGPTPTFTFDRPDQLVRPASDWTRDDSGRPDVKPDPTWTPETAPAAWVKDGAVLPSRPYTRVTTYAEAPLDGTMLARWKMRRVALGAGRRPDYVVRAASLTAEDRDREALNDLAEKMLEAAGPNAADVGSALHGFTERIDRGEPVGEVPPAYLADLDAYREQVQRITWRHREERMVCDQLETAGTPDGLGFVDEPDPDGVVDLLRVVDLKTGNIERTAGKFSVQLGVYAHSALYDAATGRRTWLADLDQRWGVVLHMPAGVGTAELRWLNLEHGWLGARLAGPIRRWRTVGFGELYRPLVRPEPRQVPEGKCAGRKRDGQPCTFTAKVDGFCARHQDQVGTDPDAAVPARVQRVAAELESQLAALEDAAPSTAVDPAVDELDGDASYPDHGPEDDAAAAMGLPSATAGTLERPATGVTIRERPDGSTEFRVPTGAVEPQPMPLSAADSGKRCERTDLLVGQCACPDHRPDLVRVADDGAEPDDGPRELPAGFQLPGQPDVPEQNGNPTPHSSMPSPAAAADAGQDAEKGLLQQVAACRTNGELVLLYERTGAAWTPAVKSAASEHRKNLPQLAQLERAHAALTAALQSARSQGELVRLWSDPANQRLWTDEHTELAKRLHGELPPF